MHNCNESPASLEPCFAHRHMRAAEYGFYELCRALAHKTGTVYFDGRAIAARFSKMSKSTAYDLAHALIEKGFFRVVREPGHRKNGTYQPYYFKVIPHDEWAQEHPGMCSPVQKEVQVSEPVQKEDWPVQKENQPVQIQDSPVQPAGHNPIKSNPLKSNPIGEADMAPPVPLSGQGVSAEFMSRYRRPGGASGSARVVPARPVQKEVQAVSDTAEADLTERAEQALLPFHRELGIALDGQRREWIERVKELMRNGHTEGAIALALKQCVSGADTHRQGVHRHQSYGPVAWFDQMEREMADAEAA